MSEFYSSSVELLPTINDDAFIIEALNSSMDTPMNGSFDPKATLTYFKQKPYSFIAFLDSTPAALFGLDKKPKHSFDHWFTSTLVFDSWRGKGVNLELKRSIATSAALLDIPLGIIIRDWNARSINATNKAFPEVTPEKVALVQTFEGSHLESNSGWIFDLCNTPVKPPTAVTFVGLETSLAYWWEKEKALHSTEALAPENFNQTFTCNSRRGSLLVTQ